MPFASETQVNAILKPHFGTLVDLVQTAHTDFRSSVLAASLQAPRVRANFIWNQFLFHAKARFEGSSDISVDSRRHWQGLMVGSAFFIRMKKGTAKLLSRNYPTQAALAFNDANVDLFEGTPRLELIYTLDELETGIDRIVLAQRHLNRIVWAIDLLDSAEDHGQTVFPLPIVPNGDSPATRVLKPKKAKTASKKQGTDDAGA
ncbi:MAG: hypothetical protein Q8K21_19160 [Hydrogenophaga sp.]|jgi:hypothetical protein|uniref:hypothetical protein n=1 Tax=Hydrogenophaga sp. TaxID=1904254 RepID=UPI002730CAE4|nr:hypothetical protein [Hydrogenophaga sp.]MDP2166302.1 hypothetical protein [Hydrogenophaga sp.]MDP3477033.1 hypothetical protein [Hydrogenophaga sp.]